MNIATYDEINTTCLLLVSRSSVGTSLRNILELLYNTGLRIEEAIQLKRFTVDATTFIVDTEKNSLNRTFPLALLPVGYLPYIPLSSPPFGRVNMGSYTSCVRHIFNVADKIYYKGDKNVLTNIFRYRYAKSLQMQGYTIEQIQEAFGHLSQASTLSYLADLYW